MDLDKAQPATQSENIAGVCHAGGYCRRNAIQHTFEYAHSIIKCIVVKIDSDR